MLKPFVSFQRLMETEAIHRGRTLHDAASRLRTAYMKQASPWIPCTCSCSNVACWMLGYLLASLLVCLLAYRYLLACAVTGAGTGKPMRQFREELTFIPVTPRYGLVRAVARPRACWAMWAYLLHTTVLHTTSAHSTHALSSPRGIGILVPAPRRDQRAGGRRTRRTPPTPHYM